MERNELKGNKEYEEFVEKFSNCMKEEMGEGIEIHRDSIQKINGELDGIVVKYPESAIAPTIYLEGLYQKYQDGYTTKQLSKEMAEKINKAYKNAPKLPEFTRKEAEEKLYSVLINEKDNQELLRGVPHEILGDMAIIPKYRVDDEASIVVSNTMCSKLRMTSEEVMEAANRNTDKGNYECYSMNDVMRDIMKRQEVPDEYIENYLMIHGKDPMYVLTNQNKYEGSAAMISPTTMDAVYKKMKEEYSTMNSMYVIPSSRHELILLPDTEVVDEKNLEEMHKEVQKEELEDADRLSNKVYKYDSRTKKITMVEEIKKTKQEEPQVTKSLGRSC